MNKRMTARDSLHDRPHDLAHLLGTLGARFADDLVDHGQELVVAEGRRQELLHDGELRGLLPGEIVPASLLVLEDRLAPLLGHPTEDREGRIVVQLGARSAFAPRVDGLFLELAADQGQGVLPRVADPPGIAVPAPGLAVVAERDRLEAAGERRRRGDRARDGHAGQVGAEGVEVGLHEGDVLAVAGVGGVDDEDLIKLEAAKKR